MEIRQEKCSRCGKIGYIIPSNNPLIEKSICLDCINAAIDVENLEHFAFFCRTFNYSANVNLYLVCLKKNKNTAIKDYIENLYNNGELKYEDQTTDK